MLRFAVRNAPMRQLSNFTAAAHFFFLAIASAVRAVLSDAPSSSTLANGTVDAP